VLNAGAARCVRSLAIREAVLKLDCLHRRPKFREAFVTRRARGADVSLRDVSYESGHDAAPTTEPR
jgi:hypothetical protein